jgi:predicted amidohydrolase
MTKIAITQIDCAVGDVDANVSKACDMIADAASQGADLVLLPEVFTTGFVLADQPELAESIPGPTTERFSRAAVDGGTFVVAGMAERDPGTGDLHNAAVVIAPDGGLVARYRKVYLYLGERDTAVPGCDACLVDLGFAKAGVTICYDYIFPHYVHGLVERGAELLLHSTAWVMTDDCEKWHYPAEAYRAQCMTRALENSVFFASSNHCGTCDANGHLRGVGQSAVIAPWGEILAEIPEGEGVAVAEVDFSKIEEWRKTAAPYLADWDRDIRWGTSATLLRDVSRYGGQAV